MLFTNEELQNIKGGSKSLFAGIIFGIAGAITILIGIIDGYINPIKCNK